jgi:tRNA1Val (adenine37-N6)-methyltransferase
METNDPISGYRNKNIFHFKQFSVRHERSSMKVGTDGVMLGAWTKIDKANRILDIGTGSGLIALMLAQRTSENTHIDAVEIQQAAYTDAQENVDHSPWKNKIVIHHLPIQQFKPNYQFDLIVSNPPYFQYSLLPPTKERETSRHSHSLPPTELIQSIKHHLTPHGRFSIILPYREGMQFIDLAKKENLYCSRQCTFQTRQHKPIERLLLEFTRVPVDCETGHLLLYSEMNTYSTEYQQLTNAFYLKM